MIHRTTLNIHHNILYQLEQVSNNSGKPISDIISLLLQLYSSRWKGKITLYKKVSYQPRDIENKWKCTHISLDTELYEICINMRCFFKLSLSHILALSVKKYLNEAIEILNGKHLDKNLPESFILILHEVKGVPIFIQTWIESSKYAVKLQE